MNKLYILILLFVTILTLTASSQTSSLTVTTSVSKKLKDSFNERGRIFLFINNNREPRLNTWPDKRNWIFATNIENWKFKENFTFNNTVEFTKSVDVSLEHLPQGKYRIQVLWDQNFSASRINAEGNLYSEVIEIDLNKDLFIDLPLKKIVEPLQLEKHELLKEIDIKSEILSDWWGKEIRLKAAVILPRDYFKANEIKYPVRYNIAGYGGRYTRASRFLRNMDWWLSDEAPKVINVYLDGEGPFGDCYQLDSDNSGPYGTALIEELIPYIEKKYRGIGTPDSRYLDGCSTGGWVSLALQIFYPDFFTGCFSYSPDQVDFENCQLINIYEDDNAFYNEYDYLRPVIRDVTGEPIVSLKDFIQFENVLGWSNTYVTSGGQFSAFTALFSPKGEDGLPKPMFDSTTGKIDRQVAEHWRKYDLKYYVETNWETLGPKLQGKLWIWGADMDNYYLNPALRAFDKMLQKTKNPKSNAVITFTPMARHCQEYDEKKVLLQIAKHLKK